MSATTAVRERPIVLSAEEVRAVLDGRMTQSRVVVKQQENSPNCRGMVEHSPGRWGWHFKSDEGSSRFPDGIVECAGVRCPFGQPGDRLWVRETHVLVADGPLMITPGVVYDADGGAAWNVPMRDGSTVYNYDKPEVWKRRAARFLRREHARITLEITAVRVERVQDISEADAKAEGVTVEPYEWRPLGSKERPRDNDARHAFQCLWDSLNAKRGDGWDLNKWVWVREFRRIDA